MLSGQEVASLPVDIIVRGDQGFANVIQVGLGGVSRDTLESNLGFNGAPFVGVLGSERRGASGGSEGKGGKQRDLHGDWKRMEKIRWYVGVNVVCSMGTEKSNFVRLE